MSLHYTPTRYVDQVTGNVTALYPYQQEVVKPYTTLATDIRLTCTTTKILDDVRNSGRSSPVYQYVVTSTPSSPVHAADSPRSDWSAQYAYSGWDINAFFGFEGLDISRDDQDTNFQNTIIENVRSFINQGEVLNVLWRSQPNSTAKLTSSGVTMTSHYPDTGKCEYLLTDLGLGEYTWIYWPMQEEIFLGLLLTYSLIILEQAFVRDHILTCSIVWKYNWFEERNAHFDGKHDLKKISHFTNDLALLWLDFT